MISIGSNFRGSKPKESIAHITNPFIIHKKNSEFRTDVNDSLLVIGGCNNTVHIRANNCQVVIEGHANEVLINSNYGTVEDKTSKNSWKIVTDNDNQCDDSDDGSLYAKSHRHVGDGGLNKGTFNSPQYSSNTFNDYQNNYMNQMPFITQHKQTGSPPTSNTQTPNQKTPVKEQAYKNPNPNGIKYRWMAPQSQSEKTECLVCHEEFDKRDRSSAKLNCNCYFHAACIQKWLCDSGKKNCPKCRSVTTEINSATI